MHDLYLSEHVQALRMCQAAAIANKAAFIQLCQRDMRSAALGCYVNMHQLSMQYVTRST